MPVVRFFARIPRVACIVLPLALLVSTSLSATLRAQAADATLSGVVADESGGVIPGVALTLADATHGVQRHATSDSQGAYIFAAVPPGTYELTAATNNFTPVRIEGLRLAAGDRRSLAVTLKVGSLAERVSVTNDGGYTSATAGVGGKAARDPREIPQSVSVLTQQRIQDQNLTDATAALSQMTGISLVNLGGGNPQIVSRGFQIHNLQLDGGGPALFHYYTDTSLPDLAAYDRVELLRGADGLFAGAGEAGGTVNLVRKRPLNRSQILFDSFAGSWDHYRVQLDATGPLGWNGRVRGRIVAAQENRHYFYDIAKDNRTVLYGVLEANLTKNLLVTAGVNYERSDRVPGDAGLPRFSTGADLNLPRNSCLCTTWSSWTQSTPEIFAKLEQSFDNGWKVRVNYSWINQAWDTKYSSVYGGVDPVTRTGPFLNAYALHNPLKQTLLDTTLNGRFSLLGRQQEVVLGGNWQDVDNGGSDWWTLYPTSPAVDVFRFDPANFPEPATPRYPSYVWLTNGQQQFGVYGTLRSRLADKLHSIVGLRYSEYRFHVIRNEQDAETGALTGSRDQQDDESGIVTPYGGVTYDATRAIALYASYTSIFQPQGTYVTASGVPLKPLTGNSVEAGAKGSWRGGALTASLAAYQIQRNNAALYQPDLSGTFGSLDCCYVAAAEIRSKGIDAEMTGALSPGWQVFAGYTYNINHYESGYGADDGNAFMPQAPRHLLKLWTTYTPGGKWSPWTIGGGVNTQTSIYQNGTATTYDETGEITGSVPYAYTQGAFAVVSVSGEYRINDHWSVALNVNNLFDRTYRQTIGSSGSGNYYGEPRNALLTLRIRQ
jgi:outer membrane receptor for ferric coprogen and ferric-rhodotorulic acid